MKWWYQKAALWPCFEIVFEMVLNLTKGMFTLLMPNAMIIKVSHVLIFMQSYVYFMYLELPSCHLIITYLKILMGLTLPSSTSIYDPKKIHVLCFISSDLIPINKIYTLKLSYVFSPFHSYWIQWVLIQTYATCQHDLTFYWYFLSFLEINVLPFSI